MDTKNTNPALKQTVVGDAAPLGAPKNDDTPQEGAKNFSIEADKTPSVDEVAMAREKFEAGAGGQEDNSGREVIYSFSGILNTGQPAVGGNVRIDLASMNLKNFKEYPVMLFSHDSDLPIGQFKNVRMTQKGLEADGEILAGGGKPAEQAARLIQSGLMSGISVGIGFNFSDVEQEKQKDGSVVNRIMKADLSEASVVTIPADQKARITQSHNVGRSLIIDGKKFATFGQGYKLTADKDNRFSLKLCTPMLTLSDAVSQQERHLQEEKEAGVAPLDAQPQTLSLEYSDGMTADQEKEKEILIEGGLTPDAADEAVKEKQPNATLETQTTPPPPKVLKMGANPSPVAKMDTMGDLKSGADVVTFLGHKIDVAQPADKFMQSFNEAVEEAAEKKSFNGKYFANYSQAYQYSEDVRREQDNLILAMKRRDHRVEKLKFKKDQEILRAEGTEVKVRYQN